MRTVAGGSEWPCLAWQAKQSTQLQADQGKFAPGRDNLGPRHLLRTSSADHRPLLLLPMCDGSLWVRTACPSSPLVLSSDII